MQQQVWLSVGSNVEREKNVTGCIRALRAEFGELIISTVYENASFGFEGSPFYNLVVGFVSGRPIDELTRIFRQIEAEHGRVRGGPKFAARSLDIDLLTCGDMVLQEGSLVLPRSEILKYAFVLGPLAEVAGDELHPVVGKSYSELWSEFDKTAHALTPVEVPGIV
jgi:2-amino-4-hydroxy-6-hydroxymethyldihydropteridine diphosphokinase